MTIMAADPGRQAAVPAAPHYHHGAMEPPPP